MNSNSYPIDEKIVVVTRQPGDGKEAKYNESDIEGFHWSNISGGINVPLTQYYLCCYVWCNQMIEGVLAHSCLHGEGPHHIKVCITQKGNNSLLYKRLSEKAGQKPKPVKRKLLCKTAAIQHVKKSQEGYISEIELLDILEADGYNRESALRTLRLLASYGRKLIKKDTEESSLYFIPDHK